MTAAETYAARIDAVRAQRARLHGALPPSDPWGGPVARRFRADPHRPLDANLAVLASYTRPEDVLLDVGGGAGRVALPLALRCREVIIVDASPGMGAECAAAATEAGIPNARFIHANWLEAEGVQGDVALTANVTYFVREIVRFIEKLATAARRRVMITVWSVANPNQSAPLFHLVYGEEPVAVPGYRELLPVLWELGILPDVHVLPGVPLVPGGTLGVQAPQTPDDAVQLALQGQWLGSQDHARARRLIEERFAELFAASPEGFRPLWRQEAREVLITWETDQRRW
jgi:2-polyprenyl-3-methyl-5-hydroxy-6-metoxy-1,4-benzoquinol methylase